MLHVLLQNSVPTQPNWTPVMVWGLILVVVVVLALLVVTWVKKRVQAVDEAVPAGFTLSDLRRLHKAGEITDEEFERAKARTIERYKEKDKAKEAAGGPVVRPAQRDRLAERPPARPDEGPDEDDDEDEDLLT